MPGMARKTINCCLFALLFGVMFSPLTTAQSTKKLQLLEPEEEEAGTAQRRAEWLFQQRAFPGNYIPGDARVKAVHQLEQMLKTQRAEDRARQNGAAATASFPWTLIGPQPIQLATSTYAGRVTSLAVDPRNANTVFAGAAAGGVWKSTDGGNNWTPLTDNQVSLAIGSLILDPNNPDIIYAGTGEGYFSYDAYYGAGLLKSADGGTSWVNLPGPFVRPSGGLVIASLAIQYSNSQVILAGSSGGVYRSSDGGTTWSWVLDGFSHSVLFDPVNTNVAYASVTGSGVYKSADGGLTWKLSNGPVNFGGLPSTNIGRIELAIDPSNPLTLYAGVEKSTDGSNSGLFHTTDGGMTWSRLTLTDYCKPQCWYNQTIRVNPANSNVIFVGGIDLYASFDGGSSWTDVSGPAATGLHVDHHALAFAKGGTQLYDGNDGGVWSSTNPTSAPVAWSSLNSKLALAQFYPGMSIHPSDPKQTFAGTQDNGLLQYQGQAGWQSVVCGDAGWAAIDPVTDGVVFASCSAITVIRSAAGGAANTWFYSEKGINLNDQAIFLPPLVMDPSNNKTLYFGTGVLYQTLDSGMTWKAISVTLDSSAAITAIAVAPTSSDVVYVGATNGRVLATFSATSVTGSLLDRSKGLPYRYVTEVAIDPKNPQTVYATFSGFSAAIYDGGHIFRSANGGLVWTDISGNLPDIPVNDLAIDPDLANTLYAATDIGVFWSTNGGTSWAPLMNGLPQSPVLSLKLQEKSRLLRAGTHGRGAWDLQLPAGTACVYTISPAAASFPAAGGSATLNVTAPGGCAWTAVSSDSWLSVTAPGSGSGSGSIVFLGAVNAGMSSRSATLTIGGQTFTVTQTATTPQLTSMDPFNAIAGANGFTLTAKGAGFASASMVQWNGVPRATTFVDSTQLTIAVSASDLTAAGPVSMTVVDPTLGLIPSALTFFVNPPSLAAMVGTIATVAGNGALSFSGDGGPAVAASLSAPFAVATDSAGNIFIADSGNNRIRKVTPSGTISTVASGLNSPRGVSADPTSGNLYYSDSLNHTVHKLTPAGVDTIFAGMPGEPGLSPAGLAPSLTLLNTPTGIFVDERISLLLADTMEDGYVSFSFLGGSSTAPPGVPGYAGDGNSNGIVPLLFDSPMGVTGLFNPQSPNSLPTYKADTGNHRVRMSGPTGNKLIAGTGTDGFAGDGGPAASAQLSAPRGVLVDPASNVYIADTGNNRVRKVDSNKVITTVAGSGGEIFSGDNLPALSTNISSPSGLAFNPFGNLLIADTGNNRIRELFLVAPNSCGFSILSGSASFSANAANGAVGVVAGGGCTWSVTSSASWIVPATKGSSSYGTVFFTVAANPDTTSRTGTITIGGQTFTVNQAGVMPVSFSLSPLSINFSAAQNDVAPVAQTTVLANLGTGALNWTATVSPPAPWIMVAPLSGTGAAMLTLAANQTGLAKGTYTTSIQVSAPGATAQSVAVSLVVSGPLPVFTASGITNAASFVSGVTPGGLTTLFGKNLSNVTGIVLSSGNPVPTQLSGTSVLWGGVASPLVAVANVNGSEQINLVVPYEVTGQASAPVTINNNGAVSTLPNVTVSPTLPGVFTVDGSAGAILHGVGNQLITAQSPAQPGEIVVIYATGLGPVSPTPATGALAPGDILALSVTNPTVTVGGLDAPVQFSGLAPGYAGLFQVNVLIPTGVANGAAVPVVVTAGGVTSKPVTLAIGGN